ncbi:MAG: M10 family metallopeptidase C-terminal domain-containing protein [Arsenophonus sp. NC-QC1-MAG3]
MNNGKNFIHFVFMIKLLGNSAEIIITYNNKDHFYYFNNNADNAFNEDFVVKVAGKIITDNNFL